MGEGKSKKENSFDLLQKCSIVIQNFGIGLYKAMVIPRYVFYEKNGEGL